MNLLLFRTEWGYKIFWKKSQVQKWHSRKIHAPLKRNTSTEFPTGSNITSLWKIEEASLSGSARTLLRTATVRMPQGVRDVPTPTSDDAILCSLMIRGVFHCKLRQLQGFIEALITVLGFSLDCPHYLVFCHRAKKLNISLRKPLNTEERLAAGKSR